MKAIPASPSRKLEVGLARALGKVGGSWRGLKPGVQRSTLAPRFTPAAIHTLEFRPQAALGSKAKNVEKAPERVKLGD